MESAAGRAPREGGRLVPEKSPLFALISHFLRKNGPKMPYMKRLSS